MHLRPSCPPSTLCASIWGFFLIITGYFPLSAARTSGPFSAHLYGYFSSLPFLGANRGHNIQPEVNALAYSPTLCRGASDQGSEKAESTSQPKRTSLIGTATSIPVSLPMVNGLLRAKRISAALSPYQRLFVLTLWRGTKGIIKNLHLQVLVQWYDAP